MLKKGFILVVSILTLFAVLGGCASGTSSANTNTSADTSTNMSADTSADTSTDTNAENTYLGQITAIDGNTITLAIGTQNDKSGPSGDNGTPPSASANSGNSTDLNAAPSATANGSEDSTQSDGTSVSPSTSQNGAPPSKPSGDSSGSSDNGTGQAPDGQAPSGMPEGGGFGGLTLTGEEQQITVSDSTTITIASSDGSETGTVSDLKVGDTVTVVMSGDTAASVTVMKAGMGGAPGKGGSKTQSE